MSLLHTYETIRDGRTFVVEIVYDADHGLPWEEYDCHGIVRERGRGSLREGERPMRVRDGRLFAYDFPASLEKAKQDGWGSLGPASESHREEQARQAVERDYQRLLDYVEERWYYVGVVVYEMLANCEQCGHARRGESVSLWGIESDDDYYHDGGAGLDELLEEAISLTDAA